MSTQRRRILYVEDEGPIGRPVSRHLEELGFEVVWHTSADAGLAALDKGPEFGAVLLDLSLGKDRMQGPDLMTELQERAREGTPPVIVLTGDRSYARMLELQRAFGGGVLKDYLIKGYLGPSGDKASPRNEYAMLALALDGVLIARQGGHPPPAAIGVSESMVRAYELLRMAATAPTTLRTLIQGETGTGKEVAARLLHHRSDRREKPFVTVNCAAIPENLIESELFGHEKGAFTGATNRHAGRFAQADGGTLFLDEIGELPLALQAKLLRALQEGTFVPVGAEKEVEVDVRVVSATNRSLADAVAARTFREDLLFRLAGLVVTMPPLRERRQDVVPLFRQFLRAKSSDFPLVEDVQPQREVEALLEAEPFPGNVRELEATVERALLLAQFRGEKVLRPDLVRESLAMRPATSSSVDPAGSAEAALVRLADHLVEEAARAGFDGASSSLLQRLPALDLDRQLAAAVDRRFPEGKPPGEALAWLGFKGTRAADSLANKVRSLRTKERT